MKSAERSDGIPLMEDGDSDDGRSISSFDYETNKFASRPISRPLLLSSLQWTRRRIAIVSFTSFLIFITLYTFFFADWTASGPSFALRPGLHFAAPVGQWLNDANGLFVDANGTWHMYYQHLWSPEGDACKNWAHVTSTDLYSWTAHGVPIECSQTHGIWSGSIVIDTENSSGLFPKGQQDGVVAIYTQHGLDHGTEEQSIAYSTDNGLSFHNYTHNPVLAHGKPSYDFRDPKVFWHAKTRKWVMVVAVAAQQLVEIYLSTNLRDWSLASSFSNPALSDEHPSFECPNLIEMPVVDAIQQSGFPSADSGSLPQSTLWMLTLSSGSGHPGPHGGGSVVRYFPGEFNGTHFSPVDSRTDRLLDFGPDFYATQFYQNARLASEGPVSISWAANLADCDDVPSGSREQWRGMMALPRTGTLMLTKDGDIRYISGPVGLDALRGKKVTPRTAVASNYSTAISYKDVPSGAVVVDLKISLKDPIPHGYEYSFPVPRVVLAFESSNKADTLTCSISLYKGGPKFACSTADGSKQMSTPIPRFNGEDRFWEVQMVIDHSILEAYLNRGLRAGTMTMWPKRPYERVVYKVERWNEDVGVVELSVQELVAPVMS